MVYSFIKMLSYPKYYIFIIWTDDTALSLKLASIDHFCQGLSDYPDSDSDKFYKAVWDVESWWQG